MKSIHKTIRLATAICLAGVTISIVQAKDFRSNKASALVGKSREELKVVMDEVLADIQFKPFYQGADLNGVETNGNWVLQKDGSLLLTPREGESGWKRYGSYLWADKLYTDFAIDFQFKYGKGGNSGLYFRVADKTNPVKTGCELQINDTVAKGDKNNHHDIGGLLTTHPAAVNAGKPAGEWNRMILRVQGERLDVYLNGFQIQDIDLSKTRLKDRPVEGYVGFQDHGVPFQFRNLKIADLSKVASAEKAPASSSGVEGISLNDPDLVVELIDTHPTEFFLSHDMDLSGRLFMGSREAVFVYERRADGGFVTRQELYRFPKDTWVYDIETYGDDLLVLTNTALFRMPGAIKNRKGVKAEKILWGNPLGHHHQGMHAIEFGPSGDLLIAMGDPHPGVNLNKQRPDHLWHWTWYVGPENKPVAYTGVGAVMRLRLQDYQLSVYARGLRNPCGISFDQDWNLFANDNDQEGSTASPGRLMFVPPNSWGGWARGWAGQYDENRLELLPAANLQLDVPVGQSYYGGSALGEKYRGSIFVANWGSHNVSRLVPIGSGAGFSATSEPLLTAAGKRRPVSAMTTNDGQLIVSVCYMDGNEKSPQCRTDLLLVSPRTGEAGQFDHSKRSPIELLSSPWRLRYKAHQEILRQGGASLTEAARKFNQSDQDAPEFSSLIFLAAAHGDADSLAKITSLTQGKGHSAILAWRVAATYPERFEALRSLALSQIASRTKEPATLMALLEYLHARAGAISPQVIALAAHDDSYVRQLAAILLAEQLPREQLAALSAGDEKQRLAGVMATMFRLWSAAEQSSGLPKNAQVALTKQLLLDHPGGKIDLGKLEPPIGIFTLSDWWAEPENRTRSASEFAMLQTALSDEDAQISTMAATALFFFDDARVKNSIATIQKKTNSDLSLVVRGSANPKALKAARKALRKAKLSTATEIPKAFRGIDWNAKNASDDANKGKELFTQRGCIACHLAPDDGKGGAIGPSLVGARDRFPADYLAASMLVPNQTVSPNFHPNSITMKDGTVHTGFVEADGSSETLKLRVITGQLEKLVVKDIAKRDVSEQSMMPANLILSPKEMRDMIAFLSLPLDETAPKK